MDTTLLLRAKLVNKWLKLSNIQNPYNSSANAFPHCHSRRPRYGGHALVAAKRITPQEVRHAAGNAGRIAEIERQLAELRGNDAVHGPGRPAKNGTAKPKRKFTMTPKARAARKLQGQYMGTLRSLSADQKDDVKVVAKNDGIAAGLKAARKYRAENLKKDKE